jgi:hypothetical protein
VCQERLNDWYATHQTAFDPKKGNTGKLDRKFLGKLLVNKTVKTPLTSTFLSADCLKLKTDRMSNKLMHVEAFE